MGILTREIVQVPDPILREISNPVETIDSYVQELVKEMFTIVNNKRCIGLAAVQLGELRRVIAVVENIHSPDLRHPVVLINPEIVKRSDKVIESVEGCLSVANGVPVFHVRRHKIVKVRGLNLRGDTVVFKEHGLLACALQHEIDHLNGKLIVG